MSLLPPLCERSNLTLISPPRPLPPYQTDEANSAKNGIGESRAPMLILGLLIPLGLFVVFSVGFWFNSRKYLVRWAKSMHTKEQTQEDPEQGGLVGQGLTNNHIIHSVSVTLPPLSPFRRLSMGVNEPHLDDKNSPEENKTTY